MPIEPADATTLERPRHSTTVAWLWSIAVLHDGSVVPRPGARPLQPGRLVLGRPQLADWGHRVHPLLSRAHLALTLADGDLVAEDLGSRNGSWRNGRRLAPGVAELVSSGDVLRLGDTLLLARRTSTTLRAVSARGVLEKLRGDAPVMHRLRGEVQALAPRDTRALLLGESGAGKGVTAEALHWLSGRPGSFLSINCAAIPHELAESALFGHTRGAFTGARSASKGFFREAHRGTLFLDEIADLPLALQPKLLHAVESGAVHPIGAAQPVPVDVRILAATSLDLTQVVADGRFRGELAARLSEYVLRVPPLRERAEDILPLFVGAAGKQPDPDLAQALLLHAWPFNVRELLQVSAEAGVRGADAPRLRSEHVGGRVPRPGATTAPAASGAAPSAPPSSDSGPPTGAEVEAALAATGGQVTAAAHRLGRSRRQLYRDLARLDIDPADFRAA